MLVSGLVERVEEFYSRKPKLKNMKLTFAATHLNSQIPRDKNYGIFLEYKHQILEIEYYLKQVDTA